MATRPCIAFPAPPLKFRTSGFPQYGFKLEFNLDLHWQIAGLSSRPAYATTLSVYTRLQPTYQAPVASQYETHSYICFGALLPRLSSPETLGSPVGSVVPPGLCLLWSHPRLSPRLSPYLLRPIGSALHAFFGLGARDSPICSACLYLRAAFRTPADQLVAFGCFFTNCSGLRPIRTGSASASPRSPVPARSRNEAAKFALCYGPKICWPFTGKDFYVRAFTSSSHLKEASNITTRAYSQFPRPDFHRLDTRPYGLRANDANQDVRLRKTEERIF